MVLMLAMKKHVNMISVAEMNMLRRMSDKKDMIRNEDITNNPEGTTVEDTTRKNRLRWFDHVHRRLEQAIVKRSDGPNNQ